MEILLRAMNPKDASGVMHIYEEGLLGGHASFESSLRDWKSWDSSHLHACRVVAENAGALVGWAALSAVSTRYVYGGVAEVSVYVSSKAQGHGVGTKMMKHLIESTEKEGYWTLQVGIFPENKASLRLHEKLGFRQIGIRESLGKMSYGPLQGQWRDLILLERRSRRIGI